MRRGRRFNSPPGWPPPPNRDWLPEPGWRPDPRWPAPPPGWRWFVDDGVVLRARYVVGAAVVASLLAVGALADGPGTVTVTAADPAVAGTPTGSPAGGPTTAAPRRLAAAEPDRTTVKPRRTTPAPRRTTRRPKRTAAPTVESTPAKKRRATPTPTRARNGCDPNYTDCVPTASDVDCAGGQGNGPAYFAGVAEVIGSDIYELDRDGDGFACEPY